MPPASNSAEYMREYRRKNPAYKDSEREYYRAWKTANPTKAKANDRRQILRRYGLTPELFERMKVEQGGRCKICELEFTGTPHIDHCHASGAVRGLLCRPCNLILGYAKDNPARLERAAKYLRTK